MNLNQMQNEISNSTGNLIAGSYGEPAEKRSPKLKFSQDHTFGVKPLATDNMNMIVEQKFAEQFANAHQEKQAMIREQVAMNNKKIQSKPTKTSIVRAIASKKLVHELDQAYPEYVSVLKERRLRGLSQAASQAGLGEKKTPDRYSKASSNKVPTILPDVFNKRQTSEKPSSSQLSRTGV